MAHARLVGFIASGLLALSCAAPPPPPPRAPAPPPPPPPDALVDRAWGVAESPRFFVSVPLPEVASWRVDDTTGRWLVATHLPSKSILWLRAFREGAVVSHDRCEALARPWRKDLFGPDPSALVDRRELDAPEDFRGEVGYAVHRAGNALGGVAILSAANVRQCLVVAYATRAEGPSAPAVVAKRLAFVTEKIFARLSTLTVEDRVPAVPAR